MHNICCTCSALGTSVCVCVFCALHRAARHSTAQETEGQCQLDLLQSAQGCAREGSGMCTKSTHMLTNGTTRCLGSSVLLWVSPPGGLVQGRADQQTHCLEGKAPHTLPLSHFAINAKKPFVHTKQLPLLTAEMGLVAGYLNSELQDNFIQSFIYFLSDTSQSVC